MSMQREEYWTELQTIGTTSILIELTRFGLLWHGNAAIVKDGKRVDRNALAVAWGADREQVYQEVMKGAHYSLEHRKSRKTKIPGQAETNGMFVMGTWRSFAGQVDNRPTRAQKKPRHLDDVS